MSNRCLRPLAVLAAVVCLGIPCRSQTSENLTIKGELRSDTPDTFSEYRIELAATDPAIQTEHTDVQFDGSFQLRSIRSGTYTLRVTTLYGNLVHQEVVSIVPQRGLLTVRLPPSTRTPLTPGTVSLAQLQHPPARKAFQAVVAAQRYSESGQFEKAAAELEKAVRISPEYADAYNNLAVQHMRLGLYQQAAEELTRAIAIAGPGALSLSNLAFAQFHLNRLPEAVAAARAALRLDSGCAQAHLILGSILSLDPRSRGESIPHLERAAQTLPSARVTLDKLRRLGEPEP